MHIMISGLAGTGKSTELRNQIKNRIEEREINKNSILYISFNKLLEKEARKKCSYLSKNQIRTLHSLCYHILEMNGQLPAAFTEKALTEEYVNPYLEPHDRVTMNANLKSEHYDSLILEVQKLSGKEIRKAFPEVELIIIDEYQDFQEHGVKLLRHLRNIYDSDFIIGVDPLQKIYSFLNRSSKYKVKDNFKTIEADLDITINEKVVLRKNYRCQNPATLKAINSMVKNCLPLEDDYTYEVEEEEIRNRFSKPIFRVFKHQADERDFVFREIRKLGHNQKIRIISRYKRDLLIYEKFLEQSKEFMNYDIEISTIHKVKGLAANNVFLVGYNLNPETSTDEDEVNLYYVALTRTRNKLFISTSYPSEGFKNVFEAETIQFSGKQTKLFNEFYVPLLKRGKNFSVQKLQKSMIDSIYFKVRMEDAPFCRYIKQTKGKPVPYINAMEVDDGIDNFSIRFQHSHKVYTFNFCDLSRLHKNGYDDLQIVKRCINNIEKFFDSRLNPSDISLTGIDLNKYFKCSSSEKMYQQLQELAELVRESDCKSIFDDNHRENSIDYKKDMSAFPDFDSLTLYVNHHSQKSYGLTTAIYRPDNKEKREAAKDHDIRESLLIHSHSLYKIELRLKNSEFLKGKKVFGKPTSAPELLEYVKTTGLETLYNELFQQYYGTLWRP